MTSADVFFKDAKTGMLKKVSIESKDKSADTLFQALRGVAKKCVVLNPTLHLKECFTLADVCQLAPDYLFQHHDLTKCEIEIPGSRKANLVNQTVFPLLSGEEIQAILSNPNCYLAVAESIYEKEFRKN